MGDFARIATDGRLRAAWASSLQRRRGGDAGGTDANLMRQYEELNILVYGLLFASQPIDSALCGRRS